MRAVRLGPNEPFIVRTAGQLMAWYDSSLVNHSALGGLLRADLAAVALRYSDSPDYLLAYRQARQFYGPPTAVAASPQEQYVVPVATGDSNAQATEPMDYGGSALGYAGGGGGTTTDTTDGYRDRCGHHCHSIQPIQPIEPFDSDASDPVGTGTTTDFRIAGLHPVCPRPEHSQSNFDIENGVTGPNTLLTASNLQLPLGASIPNAGGAPGHAPLFVPQYLDVNGKLIPINNNQRGSAGAASRAAADTADTADTGETSHQPIAISH